MFTSRLFMINCFAQSAVFFQFQGQLEFSMHSVSQELFVLVCSISEKPSTVSWLTFWHRILGPRWPSPLVLHCSAKLSQQKWKVHTPGLVHGRLGWDTRGVHQGEELVASISSLRITRYSMGSWESPNYVRNSTPPTPAQKRGVELIFHSFPSPPLHPSLHQATRLSPPRPCAPSTSCLPYLPRIFRDIW